MLPAVRGILAASIPICLLASPARADVSAAARAFADGQSAQLEGDYDHAAQSFELAFTNAPSKEALRSAIRARQLAGQLARAATLAEVLVAQYGSDATSTKLAGDVLAEARPKLARITVACSARCALVVDGRAISLPPAETRIVYLQAGRHAVEATFEDGRTATREVTAAAGADSQATLEPPPPQAEPSEAKPEVKTEAPAASSASASASARAERDERHGLPPAVALTGAAVALGLTGVAIWSGIDTDRAHDAYLKNPTHASFTAGRSKQLRTNLLFGGALAVGAASAVVAVWWTQWGTHETPPAVSFAPAAGGGLVTYGASF